MGEAGDVAEEALDFRQWTDDGAIFVAGGEVGAESDQDIEDEDSQISLV